ncbi:hypothetical protein OPV22_022226 [Ensete ventricosum]|nr:hypothetical protein OPV22_022226 [Ensete ventricosum]RRT62589.1 hypothetical protein B296_00043324 [Ensete ventricosum]RWW79438.1 hypothetical protein BHE74_00012284 [Ensete ventricosum]
MGNCLDLQKPVTWVDDEDDDWGFMETRSPKHSEGQRKDGAEAAKEKAGSGSTEIKIKISKKQLEELLRQADDGEKLPLRRFLVDLVTMGESWDLHHDQGSHWRPELQSIPEAPE